MLVSSIIANYVLTLPTIILEFVMARLIFHVTVFGNVFGVFVLCTLGVASFASFGLIIASVMNTMQETQIINQLIWFAFLFCQEQLFRSPYFRSLFRTHRSFYRRLIWWTQHSAR